MSDNWDFYVTESEGKVASVFLDLGIHEIAPDPHRHWLHVVSVELLAPSPNGLIADEELGILHRIEERLAEELGARFDAVFVGRITTGGRREFYFYLPRRLEDEGVLRGAFQGFPEYVFSWSAREDSSWATYLNFLYPSVETQQTMKNQRVLEVLEEHGDRLEQLRSVRHWAYFGNEHSRAMFAAAAQALNFSIDSLSERQDVELGWGVCLFRMDPVDHESINEVTLALLEMARAQGGEYDGWETEIVKEPE